MIELYKGHAKDKAEAEAGRAAAKWYSMFADITPLMWLAMIPFQLAAAFLVVSLAHSIFD